ncbi:MAG: YdcF family protein [Rhodobacteraceae bacterium]|nr:YdcF family protein [Paracoccaceae bacterium]
MNAPSQMYEIAKLLVLPPTSLVVLVLAGWVARRWFPRAGHAVIWLGVGLLYAISTPLVSNLLSRAAEAPPGPRLEALAAYQADAIVILSAGMERDQPEYGGETVDHRTLVRMRYGARVQRATELPVLVTGGLLKHRSTPVAVAMQRSLIEDFRIPVKWVEPRSRTTAENAAFSAAILKPEGVTRIILVTHAMHMRRSQAVFEAAGLEVVPAPTGFTADLIFDLQAFLPSASSLEESHVAAYELIGSIWYFVSGQL